MEPIKNKYIHSFNPGEDKEGSVRNKTVYHYTSPEGLFGILRSRSLRFTDCQFMNDKSEFSYILKPLKTALNESSHLSLYDTINDRFVPAIEQDFQTEYYDVEISKKGIALKTHKMRYYIFCSSTAKDSLNMWNYYVKNGSYQGYNIGFKVNELRSSFSSIEHNKIRIFFGHIVYSLKDQISLLKDVLLKIDEEYQQALRQIKDDASYQEVEDIALGKLKDYLDDYRLFFKDGAFSSENEYRFIVRAPIDFIEDNTLQTKFIVKNGIMVPYIETHFDNKLAIKSITISPMLEEELAKHDLDRLLESLSYNRNIEIVQSTIPIRY